MLSRLTTTIAGILLIGYGVIAGLSPLPGGVVAIVFGVLMIVAANPAARPVLRRLRGRWPWFNAMVKWLGGKAPAGPIKSVALETSPDGPNAPETNNPP